MPHNLQLHIEEMKINWFHFLLSIFALLRGSLALLNGENLKSLEDERGFIKVNDDNYSQLSRGIKDYYSILFITISDDNPQDIQCNVCHDLEDTLIKVLAITRKQAPGAKLLVFESDVTHNSQLLREMNLNTIPHILVFPPPSSDEFKWSVDPFYQYEIDQDSPGDLLHFGDFLAQVLNVHLELHDFDYAEFGKYFICFVIFFVFLKKVVVPRLSNAKKAGLMLISFAIILVSICGYKFTEINAIPFIARDDEGKIMYFSGGTGWQFGIEIFTVSMMYITMGGLALLLVYSVKMPVSARAKNLQGAILSCILFFAFSYYTKCYQVKAPDYPFVF